MKIYFPKRELQAVAQRRIVKLFQTAILLKDQFPEYSAQEIALMRRISRRANITIPKDIKRYYCHNCNHLYGSRTRIRLFKGVLVVSCGNCGDRRRFKY
ncbi:MAG TPA: ribonuclease P [Thermoplasmataceae archaeon]|nr:ribonuclease P [Thermoplasmatales archaeon AK]HLH85820.1 ribonuclease P [Thermoplasmataceae archaeon]